MSTAEMSLSRDEARWIAVTANRLDRRPFRRRATADDLIEMIRYLRIVQLDTISVISRSHETVLWSRLGPYDTAIWPTLYEPKRMITEHWAHVASIIPIEDLPLFRWYMQWFRDKYANDMARPDYRRARESVLAHLASEGPAASRHFERPENGRQAAAWEWYGAKPEREALADLWMSGEVILRQRDKSFTRIFDLMERVLPGFWDAEPIPDEERELRFIRTAMRVLGIATSKWVADYYRSGTPHVPVLRTRAILEQMAARDEIIPVSVPGIKEPMWLDCQYAGLVDDLRAGRRRPTLTTLLSPFDNLVWNRDRDEKLFDFEYRIECYTPAPKRKYGYYTLPILHRGKLVGRLDPSYDRKKQHLTIKALYLEPWVRPSASLGAAIAGAVEDLLQFLGGREASWALGTMQPEKARPFIVAGANRLA